jgi:hypothetical protein
MADFRTEFPDFPAADMPAMPEGFEDSSWGNDACPSISSEKLGLLVYVDYVDTSKREEGCEFRFAVFPLDEDGSIDHDRGLLQTTDDWAEVLALIDSKRVAS